MSGAANSTSHPLAALAKGRLRLLGLVGLLVYVAALSALGWRDVAATLSSLNIGFLVALMLIEATALWMRAAKWRIALGAGQGAIRLCFISKAGGNLTPARVGEFSPLLFSDSRNAKVAAWILVDRILEASATLILGIVGLVFVLGAARGAEILALSLVVLGTLLLAAFLLTRRAFIAGLAERAKPATRARRVLNLLESVSEQAIALGRSIYVLGLVTAVATVLDLVVAYCLYMSFGFAAAFTVLALAQCVHALTSVVPFTPNATGVPYVAAAAILHQFGGVPLEVLAAAVALRFAAAGTVFWTSFAIGMLQKTPSAIAVDGPSPS